jgi:hypothetical protein
MSFRPAPRIGGVLRSQGVAIDSPLPLTRYVAGSRRFFAKVGAVMAVHAALLAAAPRPEGALGKHPETA